MTFSAPNASEETRRALELHRLWQEKNRVGFSIDPEREAFAFARRLTLFFKGAKRIKTLREADLSGARLACVVLKDADLRSCAF